MLFLSLFSAQNEMSAKVKRAVFCQEKLDLAFIIDSSSSIPTKDFELQINFVKDIVRFLDFGSNQSRVAAVSFSNKLFPEFQFDDYTTKDEVLEAITSIQHSRGDATRTYLALEHTSTVIFKPGNGERPDAKDVVIVLTDGETNSGSYDHHWAASAKRQTQFEAARIKARPAVIFAIGVGSAVDVAELNGMSSDPDDQYTIQFATFGDLNTDGVKQVLLDKKCGGRFTLQIIKYILETFVKCIVFYKYSKVHIVYVPIRKALIYQMGNQKPAIEKAQTMEWQKIKRTNRQAMVHETLH